MAYPRVGYGVLGISWSRDHVAIFQNIQMLYVEYGVLSLFGYGVLIFILLWSLGVTDWCQSQGYRELGGRVGRGEKGRGPKGGNDERVDELNGQGNNQGLGANGGVYGVNGNVEGVNEGNVGNQNGNVVNENVQENVGNVLVNSNLVGCSYKEFLACNPKEYDGKGGVVVLTRWIEKMESV
ncbi:hypothetical protein Tco_0286312 [Tanacetum coccineum]